MPLRMDAIQVQLAAIQEQVVRQAHHLAGLTRSLQQSASAAVTATTAEARARLRQVELTPSQWKALAAVAGAAVLYTGYRVMSHTLAARAVQEREAALLALGEDGRLHLFSFPRSPFAPSLSAPCTKVETFLRASGIPYELHETTDPTGSPNGCVPFIVYRSRRIADSDKIIDFLATDRRVWCDTEVSKEDRCVGLALKRAVEYSLAPLVYRMVFVEHPELAVDMVRHSVRGAPLPWVLAKVLVRRVSHSIEGRQALTALGALAREQAEQQFLQNFAAIEATLASSTSPAGFLFNTSSESATSPSGEDGAVASKAPLTSFDCAVYACLLPVVVMARRCAVTRPDVYAQLPALAAVARSEVVEAYLSRVTDRCFPEMRERFEYFAFAQDMPQRAEEQEEAAAAEAGSAIDPADCAEEQEEPTAAMDSSTSADEVSDSAATRPAPLTMGGVTEVAIAA